MLTVREAALSFHINPNTLRRWTNQGRIKAYHINPRDDRRFKCEEIICFLAEFNGHDDDWEKAEKDSS